MVSAIPTIRDRGLELLLSQKWAPNRNVYGLLPHVVGTIYSSVVALLLGSFFGIFIAIFITEDFLPRAVRLIFKNLIELLAAIPSVIYGFWGYRVLNPALEDPAQWMQRNLDWFPLFDKYTAGTGMLSGSIVLTIMILPTITAISRNALDAVPKKLREGAYGLGATRWETIFQVVLPTASTGLFGAAVLGFGRAVGETMALAMLIGSSTELNWSILASGNTLAAVIANNWGEANDTFKGILLYGALILMLITLGINALGSFIVRRATRSLQGVRK